jgi:hypothetical protein
VRAFFLSGAHGDALELIAIAPSGWMCAVDEPECHRRAVFMRARLFRVIGVLALLALPAAAFAQFGHPLDGQWSGGWGKDSANRLLLNLDWDGKEITGVINPGPTAATVKKVTIDYSNPSSWGVKIEAEGKDTTGKPVRIMVDGKLENIGAYYKVFHGTWSQGGQKGEFTVTRN